MRAAILNDQQEVENIIVADKAFCDAHHPGRYVLLTEGQWCDFGWVWTGTSFQAPPEA